MFQILYPAYSMPTVATSFFLFQITRTMEEISPVVKEEEEDKMATETQFFPFNCEEDQLTK